jgi:arginine-tRNA-protein transferase
MRLYSALSRHGFRRSGTHVYRPHCPGCQACVPVRVPVGTFAPRRVQRRVWRANRDLRVVPTPAAFSPVQFALYSRYVSARHPRGGMDRVTPEQYLEFLASEWSDTTFSEFRLAGDLVAVAVADRLDDGLSAVYTFYAPELARRSLGTYAVLWEIEEARRLGLAYLYLGFWVRESPRMRYKASFQPLEYFHAGAWRDAPPGA